MRDTPLFDGTENYSRDFGRLAIPAVAQEVLAKQVDKAKGVEWRGIAILLAGQVRTGAVKHVVQGFRENVINPLRESYSSEDIHVFAALEFTKGGYPAWQQGQHKGTKSRQRDFNASEVEEMLWSRGANFSLGEVPPFHEKYLALRLNETNCTWFTLLLIPRILRSMDST